MLGSVNTINNVTNNINAYRQKDIKSSDKYAANTE